MTILDPDPARRCIERVRFAANRLKQVLQSLPFPSLAVPESDREALQRVESARDWWEALERTHGSPAGAGTASRIIRDVPIETRSLHWHFDPGFQGTGPRSAFDPRAADVLGTLPSQLRVLPSPFYSRQVLFSSAELLPDAEDLPTVQVTAQNWAAVRSILENGRRIVVRHCESLLDWISARIAEATEPALPSLKALGRGPHNAVRVLVIQGDTRREALLTRSQHQFLLLLQRKGHAEWPRSYRPDLLKRLPEIEPWLETTTAVRRRDPHRNAMYRLMERVRERIDLDLAGTS